MEKEKTNIEKTVSDIQDIKTLIEAKFNSVFEKVSEKKAAEVIKEVENQLGNLKAVNDKPDETKINTPSDIKEEDPNQIKALEGTEEDETGNIILDFDEVVASINGTALGQEGEKEEPNPEDEITPDEESNFDKEFGGVMESLKTVNELTECSSNLSKNKKIKQLKKSTGNKTMNDHLNKLNSLVEEIQGKGLATEIKTSDTPQKKKEIGNKMKAKTPAPTLKTKEPVKENRAALKKALLSEVNSTIAKLDKFLKEEDEESTLDLDALKDETENEVAEDVKDADEGETPPTEEEIKVKAEEAVEEDKSLELTTDEAQVVADVIEKVEAQDEAAPSETEEDVTITDDIGDEAEIEKMVAESAKRRDIPVKKAYNSLVNNLLETVENLKKGSTLKEGKTLQESKKVLLEAEKKLQTKKKEQITKLMESAQTNAPQETADPNTQALYDTWKRHGME